jgi:hypothetical protein
MKFDLEEVYDGLYKQQYGDGDDSLVVYELRDHPVANERYNYMIYPHNGRRDEIILSVLFGLESIENAGFVFIGRTAITNFVSALEDHLGYNIKNILGGRWVKSIRAGGHVDIGSGLQTTVQALEVLTESQKLSVLLRCVRRGLEELVLTRFAFVGPTAESFCSLLGSLSSVKYLTLSQMVCSVDTFKILMQGVVDNIPELQCLDISGNTLSRESVYVLKDVIIRHPKLVYLDVSLCEMDMHSFDSILDGCEISGRIQALNVQKTVARSNRGRKSLKRRMKSGKLCLLNVNFHTDDNVERFVNSLRPCFARRLKEHESINRMKGIIKRRSDLPEVMESILDSSDGVENMYKFLIGNYNEVLDLFNMN